MSAREVLRIPHPALARPARRVVRVGGSERTLADVLVATMRASPACVGLAANQIGDPRHAFCVDVTGHRKTRSCHGLIVLFDAEVVVASDPAAAREGCMSVPDLTGDVVRATRVTVRGLDPGGEPRVVQTDAFEARALLHELDHLDGLLFLDRVRSLRGDVFPRKVYRGTPRTPD